jgi:hypothetical protein
MGPEHDASAGLRGALLRAAADLADAEGTDALTPQALAAACGTTLATAVTLLGDGDLRLAAVDQLVEELPAAPSDAHWGAAVRHRAAALLLLVRAHPWSLHVLVETPPLTPGRARERAAGVARLRAAGFGPAGAAQAWQLLDAQLLGAVGGATDDPLAGVELLVDMLGEDVATAGSSPVADHPALAGRPSAHGAGLALADALRPDRWVTADERGRLVLDGAALHHDADRLSTAERALLAVVHSLVDGQPVDLSRLDALDADHRALLAATFVALADL